MPPSRAGQPVPQPRQWQAVPPRCRPGPAAGRGQKKKTFWTTAAAAGRSAGCGAALPPPLPVPQPQQAAPLPPRPAAGPGPGGRLLHVAGKCGARAANGGKPRGPERSEEPAEPPSAGGVSRPGPLPTSKTSWLLVCHQLPAAGSQTSSLAPAGKSWPPANQQQQGAASTQQQPATSNTSKQHQHQQLPPGGSSPLQNRSPS